MDFFYNGAAHGAVAETLLLHNFDLNALRPWRSKKDGRSYVTTRDDKGNLVNNYSPNPALLTKDDWIRLDTVMIGVARNQLRAWGDLVSSGSTYNLPNGMEQTILQWQTMSDAGSAKISMDGIAQGDRDRPLVDLRGLPLPIIHADFWFTARDLSISKKSGAPLDTTMLEMETRRIAETVEDMVIGNIPAYSYGGYSIPGYTTHPDRITYVITSPTAPGWTPQTLLDELLDMKEQLRLDNFRGPFALYMGTAWERFLEGDYSAVQPGVSLRQRLSINGIDAPKMMDNLSGFQILLVQKSSDVARAVTGLPLSIVQWPSEGGMKLNWKLLTIMVPQIRSNYLNNTGIVHANVA